MSGLVHIHYGTLQFCGSVYAQMAQVSTGNHVDANTLSQRSSKTSGTRWCPPSYKFLYRPYKYRYINHKLNHSEMEVMCTHQLRDLPHLSHHRKQGEYPTKTLWLEPHV